MQTGVPVAGRPKGLNTPGWIVLGILLSGGLFLFAWLAWVGRRVLSGPTHVVLWLLPIGAVLWISGASLMVKGAMAPTVPAKTGNPLFLAGFALAVICLVVMLAFNSTFTRRLSTEGNRGSIHARVIGFTIAVTGFLLSQLISEMTPVAPQNRDILVLFQLLCIMVASVVGIQWVERVHAKHTQALASTPTSTASSSANADAAQRF